MKNVFVTKYLEKFRYIWYTIKKVCLANVNFRTENI